MSAAGITDTVVKAIEKGEFDAIIMNYANADMVGHSGKLEAAIKAVEAVDAGLGWIYRALKARPSRAAWIITADHGNAEMMIDPATGGAHTYHTANRAAVRNRAPLQQNRFHFLPLTAIRPTGWLRQQLEVQAHGLGGHLDEVWSDVGPNSGWLGGSGENWERGPYFLDGLVPLAYLLDDAPLKAKAQKWMDWTLGSQ